MNKPTKKDFDKAITSLIEGIHADYSAWSYPSSVRVKPAIHLKEGRKFLKIIRDNSVWGFIALKDGSHKGLPLKFGDVLKPAGYNAPAKHTRGNIFNGDHSYYSWTGPNYLI
jgi:hypothetical protein